MQCDYVVNYFTASTQRAQIVGCSAFWPMSVSQCQQRSHFWPSACSTTIEESSPRSVSRNLISETLNNSRQISARSVTLGYPESLPVVQMSFASSDLPMSLD